LFGNRTQTRKVYKAGVWSAFSIDLYIDDSDDLIGLWNSNGIRVYVDNSSVFPTPYSDGINLMPGTSSDVIIKKYDTEKLPKPYSDCDLLSGSTHDSELYKKIIARNQAYKQKDCLFLCLQKDVIQNCKCYDLWYEPIDEETKPCLNSNETSCSLDRYNFYFLKGNQLDCKDECPLECSSLSYELFSTVSEYPTKSYLNYLKKNEKFKQHFQIDGIENITYEKVKERVLNLNIYFNELAFTQISELGKTSLVDLLANLGGELKFICLD
jgi:hypothetical protein